MTATIAQRLADVQRRIAEACRRAGRDPAAVRVVAVTKGVSVETIVEAVTAGVRDLGENRAQELLAKVAALRGGGDDELRSLLEREPTDPLALRFHFLGRIQQNKVPRLAEVVSVWHSVDRAEVGERIARAQPGGTVYAQVNIGREPQKGGCPPEETPALVERLRHVGLSVEGLMAVPPFDADPRPHFAALRELAEAVGVSGLSMGMSGDFEAAVEEGATVVRLGQVVFGPR